MKKLCLMLAIFGSYALYLAGCGGGGGSSPAATSTGVFVDKPVEGIKYVFGNFSGLTEPGGVFTYPAGTKGTFRIGDIVLGQAMGAPTVTIVDLVKMANPALTNAQAEAEATKIAQFTMTLDDTPGQETMTITRPVFNSYTGARFKSVNLLTTTQGDMNTLCQEGKPGSTLVAPAVAFTQMSTSISNLPMIRHSGEYNSTSFGGNNVSKIEIQPDGTLFGMVVNNAGEAFTLSGSVTNPTTGAISIVPFPYFPVPSGTPLPGVTVTSTSNGSGTITGKAVDTSVVPTETTNFSFVRSTSATNKYTGIFGGTYIGTSSGSFFFGIDHYGRLIGFAEQTGGAAIALSGSVNMATGQITLGTGTGGATFTGSIASDGSVSGTWKGGAADSGTFSGGLIF